MNPSTHPTCIVGKELSDVVQEETFEDEFLSVKSLDGISQAAAERTLQRCLAEIEEMVRENRWEDIVSLFFPVEEKMPELTPCGLEIDLHLKVAFALGQLKRFDDAIQVLLVSAEREPENFSIHSALGYTAYNSLYAAKNRELFLSGKSRQDRLEFAHRHLKKAQALRPKGVTNYYREGMLYKQVEGKPEEAVPLFERAISNWEILGKEEMGRRHQERKNFLKALYNLASALLATGRRQVERCFGPCPCRRPREQLRLATVQILCTGESLLSPQSLCRGPGCPGLCLERNRIPRRFRPRIAGKGLSGHESTR